MRNCTPENTCGKYDSFAFSHNFWKIKYLKKGGLELYADQILINETEVLNLLQSVAHCNLNELRIFD
jgi:hypothetical protein